MSINLIGERGKQLATLIESVKAGSRPMGISTALNSPIPIEMASQLGFDWVIVDQEHTLVSQEGLIEQIRAAERVRLPALVKVNENNPLLIRDALDAGASGIQLPDVNNIETLEAALKSMQYSETGGTRGFCPIQRSVNYFAHKYSSEGHSVIAAEEEFATNALLIPTVETRESMLNLDEMLAVDACPIWHVGPFDLGADLGISDMPEVLQRTVCQITAKIHKAGKFASVPIMPGRYDASGDPVSEMQAVLRVIGNDMPYTLDVACLAFGLDVMGRKPSAPDDKKK